MAHDLRGARLGHGRWLSGHRGPAQRRAPRPPHRTRHHRGRTARAHRRTDHTVRVGRTVCGIHVGARGDDPCGAPPRRRHARGARNRALRDPRPRVQRRAAHARAELRRPARGHPRDAAPRAAPRHRARAARDDGVRTHVGRLQPDPHVAPRRRDQWARATARAWHVALGHRAARRAGARHCRRALRDRRLDVQHVRHGAARQRSGNHGGAHRPCGARGPRARSDVPHQRADRLARHRHHAARDERVRLPGPRHPGAGHGARRACQVRGRARCVGARRQAHARAARVLDPRRGARQPEGAHRERRDLPPPRRPAQPDAVHAGRARHGRVRADRAPARGRRRHQPRVFRRPFARRIQRAQLVRRGDSARDRARARVPPRVDDAPSDRPRRAGPFQLPHGRAASEPVRRRRRACARVRGVGRAGERRVSGDRQLQPGRPAVRGGRHNRRAQGARRGLRAARGGVRWQEGVHVRAGYRRAVPLHAAAQGRAGVPRQA